MNDIKRELSIIMPALNEEENIQVAINNTLNALEDYKINGEIIVVNDGSTDKTEELLDNIIKRDNRVGIIKHTIPQGIGASFWDGVDNAKGDIVTWIPGDNENDPWEIFRYYKLLEQVDMVIPFIFNKEVRPLLRNTLSFIYRFIINTTFAVNFNYTNGTVLFRKSILKELDCRSHSFFFQTDILIRTVKKGYLFAEVPYRLGLRRDGISKAVNFPSLIRVIKGYLRLVNDYYFKKNKEINPKTFSCDSLTAKRRINMNYKVALIVLYDSERRFLLQQRSKGAKLLPDYWAFFGGGLREGETPEEAVSREAFEEINYKVKAPQLILEQDFREGDTQGYLYIYIEAFDNHKAELKLQEGQGWGWFKDSELTNLKMVERDRQIISFIMSYLEKEKVVNKING